VARFNPPTPILRGRALRKRNAEIAAKREQELAPRKRNLAKAKRANTGGSAFEHTHRILERETMSEWSRERDREVWYWDEAWNFETTSRTVAYEELYDWQVAMMRNRIVADYLKGKALSIMIEVWDPEQGRRITLTAAAARDFDRAWDDLEDKLNQWALAYGRDQDDEEFSQVRAVSMLLRGDRVHKKWSSIVKGRAEAREDRTRAKRRKRAPR
jgi:hypothetical protein